MSHANPARAKSNTPFRVDRQDSHVQVPSLLATESEHLRTADDAGIPRPGDAVADLACTWRPVSLAGVVVDVPWRTTPCLDPHLAKEVDFKGKAKRAKRAAQCTAMPVHGNAHKRVCSVASMLL